MTRMMKPFARAIAVCLVLALAMPAAAAPARWASPWEWLVGWLETWWGGPDKEGPHHDPYGQPLPQPPAASAPDKAGSSHDPDGKPLPPPPDPVGPVAP